MTLERGSSELPRAKKAPVLGLREIGLPGTKLEFFDLCPRCGHESISQGGRRIICHGKFVADRRGGPSPLAKRHAASIRITLDFGNERYAKAAAHEIYDGLRSQGLP